MTHCRRSMSFSKQKRLLIVGASDLQLPAIIKAKEMGLYVGVADYNPGAIGISYADEYFNVSTIDETGVFKASSAFRADGIMTLATDMPMRSVAYACEKLGLSGISYDTAVKATDKAVMIEALESHGVEHPWYYVVNDSGSLGSIMEKVSYPCVCKPTDNSGSRGVILVCDQSELPNAVTYAAVNGRSGKVIIEEYLRGNEVSVEIIVDHGEIHVLAVTDKTTTGAPHFVETGHDQPSQLDPDSVLRIKDLARRAVKAIGIENGAAHVEIMLTASGPKMIELGARLGGDCITSHLVPLSTGIDMVRAAIEIALGREPDICPTFLKTAAIRYFIPAAGRIRSISGVEEARRIKGVIEIVLHKSRGDLTGDVLSSISRTGYVIAQGDEKRSAADICKSAMETIKIVVGDPQ